MRRTRWRQLITVVALAISAAGLACETWAFACRTVDVDDASSAVDASWVDRTDAAGQPLFHPTADAAPPFLAAITPLLAPMPGFRLPVPALQSRPQITADAHAPRAPPAHPA